MSGQTGAIDNLLASLIDYAGLYPPAALDMRSAVRNYLSYSRSQHSDVLGRFVVDLDRLPELCAVADDSICNLRLSIIAAPTANWPGLQHLLDDGLPVESIEVKTTNLSEIERITGLILTGLIPSGITTYFELPVSPAEPRTLGAIRAAGARVKLRTGGLVAEAFPPSEAIASILESLARCPIPFKATAGLHHPIRSRHPFTYAPDSPVGTMHGFLNLFLAAALLYLGGTADQARQLLDEERPEAFFISPNPNPNPNPDPDPDPDAIAWRSFHWTAAQLRTVRKEFAISFGSCSFEEPIHDLEALGWLP